MPSQPPLTSGLGSAMLLGKQLGCFLLSSLVLSLPAWPLNAQQFDFLILNGRVLDGSGSPEFRADVGIRGQTVVAVGGLSGASADRVIDATGQLIVPGFIDMHSHADRVLVSNKGSLLWSLGQTGEIQFGPSLTRLPPIAVEAPR